MARNAACGIWPAIPTVIDISPLSCTKTCVSAPKIAFSISAIESGAPSQWLARILDGARQSHPCTHLIELRADGLIDIEGRRHGRERVVQIDKRLHGRFYDRAKLGFVPVRCRNPRQIILKARHQCTVNFTSLGAQCMASLNATGISSRAFAASGRAMESAVMSKVSESG